MSETLSILHIGLKKNTSTSEGIAGPYNGQRQPREGHTMQDTHIDARDKTMPHQQILHELYSLDLVVDNLDVR